jgi:hypothetical protein
MVFVEAMILCTIAGLQAKSEDGSSPILYIIEQWTNSGPKINPHGVMRKSA